jgi:hypothetical protein
MVENILKTTASDQIAPEHSKCKLTTPDKSDKVLLEE